MFFNQSATAASSVGYVMTITCIACFVSTPFVVAAAIFFSKNAYIAIVLFSLVGFIWLCYSLILIYLILTPKEGQSYAEVNFTASVNNRPINASQTNASQINISDFTMSPPLESKWKEFDGNALHTGTEVIVQWPDIGGSMWLARVINMDSSFNYSIRWDSDGSSEENVTPNRIVSYAPPTGYRSSDCTYNNASNSSSDEYTYNSTINASSDESAPTYEIGTRVESNYRSLGMWYPGRVIKDNKEDNTYNIRFLFGDDEDCVPINRIRRVANTSNRSYNNLALADSASLSTSSIDSGTLFTQFESIVPTDVEVDIIPEPSPPVGFNKIKRSTSSSSLVQECDSFAIEMVSIRESKQSLIGGCDTKDGSEVDEEDFIPEPKPPAEIKTSTSVISTNNVKQNGSSINNKITNLQHTLVDKVYVQNGTVGLASYHFPGGIDDCFISCENGPAAWKLANGMRVPREKKFESVSFDVTSRQFTGRIEWGSNTFQGAASLVYNFTFSPDYSYIAEGTCDVVDARGFILISNNYGSEGADLDYRLWTPLYSDTVSLTLSDTVD